MGDAKLLLLTVSVLVLLGLVQSAPYSGSEKAKRPFCNAFTGCGRKRSDPLVNALSGVDSDYGQMESSYQVSFFKRFIFVHFLIISNFQGPYRSSDGQRRFGFFPGYLRKKRAALSEELVKNHI